MKNTRVREGININKWSFFVYVRILQCAQQLNFRPINLHTVNHLKSGEWGRGGGR